MRQDMHKVIVDCRRSGSGWTNKGRTERDHEDLPFHTGMRRHDRRSYTSKWNNDRLAPLRRFLRTQVGRKWDDVYAEVRAGIDTRHTVKMHILEHLYQFIETKVRANADGRLTFTSRWGSEFERTHCQLYVDPRDRRIHLVPRRYRWRYPRRQSDVTPNKNCIVLSRQMELHRIDGIWYAIRFAKISAPTSGVHLVYDVMKKRDVQAGGRVAVEKRQLSKSELSARDLTNCPAECAGIEMP